MKIDRKQILISVLDTIQCISDKNYQKRVWIRAEGPECDDFTETCCNFFGDCDPLLKNYKDFGISDSQYQILRKFRNVFDDFSGKYHMAQEFIDTLEWDNITKMAREVLQVFHYSKKNEI